MGNKTAAGTQSFTLQDDPMLDGAPVVWLNDFIWGICPGVLRSPGGANDNQTLADISVPSGLFSIISHIVGSGGVLPSSLIENVPPGETPVIHYAAANWWRIGTLATNGVEVAEAAGKRFHPLQMQPVYGNCSNHVEFVKAEVPGAPWEWLDAFVPDPLLNHPFPPGFVERLQTSWLLDIRNPWDWAPFNGNYAPELVITGISVDAENVAVAFRLENNGTRVTFINGELKLLAAHDLADPLGWASVDAEGPGDLSGLLATPVDDGYTWIAPRAGDRMFYRVLAAPPTP
jgi:hypothetical protein